MDYQYTNLAKAEGTEEDQTNKQMKRNSNLKKKKKKKGKMCMVFE
jgi:hypothetical protein